jgi:hypothetical protein
MRRMLGWTSAALLGSAGFVQAQPGMIGTYQPPVISPVPQVSPFVNMIGSRQPAAVYFGQVQPQIAAQGNFQQINQSLQYLQGGGGGVMAGAGNALPATGTVLQTGHPVSYLNTGSYFPLFNRSLAGARGFGGTGPGGTAQPFNNFANTGFGGPFAQTLGSAFPAGAGTPFPMLNSAFPLNQTNPNNPLGAQQPVRSAPIDTTTPDFDLDRR